MKTFANPEELAKFRLENAPATVHYIPDFLSEEEESALMSSAYGSGAEWKTVGGGRRRLQVFGGEVKEDGLHVADIPSWVQGWMEGIKALPGVWPEGVVVNHCLLNEYRSDGESASGIFAHRDGPAYHPMVAIISTGSGVTMRFRPMGPSSTIISEEQGKNDEGVKGESGDEVKGGDGDGSQVEGTVSAGFDLYLEGRSLLLFTDSIYKNWTHSIPSETIDVISDSTANLHCIRADKGEHGRGQSRISLTIRNVPKTAKVKKNLRSFIRL